MDQAPSNSRKQSVGLGKLSFPDSVMRQIAKGKHAQYQTGGLDRVFLQP